MYSLHPFLYHFSSHSFKLNGMFIRGAILLYDYTVQFIFGLEYTHACWYGPLVRIGLYVGND